MSSKLFRCLFSLCISFCIIVAEADNFKKEDLTKISFTSWPKAVSSRPMVARDSPHEEDEIGTAELKAEILIALNNVIGLLFRSELEGVLAEVFHPVKTNSRQ